MLLVLAISIVVGWVRGGRLRNLTEIRVRMWWLLPLGIWIAGLGILMNFTVIVLNSGMPVLTEAVEIAGGSGDLVLGAKHVILNESTRLPFLADIIPLPNAVLSLGDVFLAIGIGAFLEDQMRKPLSLFAHGVTGVPGSAAE